MSEEQQEAQSDEEETKGQGTLNKSNDSEYRQEKGHAGFEDHQRSPRSMLKPVVTECLDDEIVGETYRGGRHRAETSIQRDQAVRAGMSRKRSPGLGLQEWCGSRMGVESASQPVQGSKPSMARKPNDLLTWNGALIKSRRGPEPGLVPGGLLTDGT